MLLLPPQHFSLYKSTKMVTLVSKPPLILAADSKHPNMAADSQYYTEKTSPKPPTPPTIGDRAFKGVGDLIKLLPTGTVFLFQFLNPLLTNTGHCGAANRWLSGALLVVCGFSCCFSSFTDSYTGRDGKVYYGIATARGLWALSDPDSGSEDLSKYKLRFGDFVHASLALVVFAVIALLDTNTVACFYPSFESSEKVLLMVLPTAVGALASSVFMVYPNNRHGIGYPAARATEVTN